MLNRIKTTLPKIIIGVFFLLSCEKALASDWGLREELLQTGLLKLRAINYQITENNPPYNKSNSAIILMKEIVVLTNALISLLPTNKNNLATFKTEISEICQDLDFINKGLLLTNVGKDRMSNKAKEEVECMLNKIIVGLEKIEKD